MMPPPVEGLGRRARAPDRGIIYVFVNMLSCESRGCLVASLLTGAFFFFFVGFGFRAYTRWKQNLSFS